MISKRKLVISWCSYNWDKSRIFVKSLRGTGYMGDIVFIEGTQDPFTLTKYNWYNVKMLQWDKTKGLTEVYLSYLNENKNNYDKVLLCDMRDVVFQRNPFDFMLDNKLHLVSEDLKIKDQILNSGWLEHAYGIKVLRQIENNQVLCAGTTYGGIIPLIEMVEKILRHVPKNSQAILNYLYWTGLLRAVVDPNDGHSVVWTIGTKIDTEHDDFYKIKDHKITTLDDVTPPVIHQYDRHPRIARILENYYADH